MLTLISMIVIVITIIISLALRIIRDLNILVSFYMFLIFVT